MVEFPKIPTRIYYHGDRAAAKKLVGMGKKRYSDLVTFMGFQGLKTHKNTLRFSDGSTIVTLHNYGLSEIHIYAPPMPKPIAEEKEFPQEGAFFYQIIHSGTVDDHLGGTITVPELVVNRIIIWEIDFEEGQYNNGQGTVILDVDIANDIVYPSANSTEDEDQIILANKYNDAIKPTIDPPDRDPPDMVEERFWTGPMCSPITAYAACGNTGNRDEVILSVNENYLPASDEWWAMIEKPEAPSTVLWQNQWCPSAGGDQDQLYTAYDWPLLDDNAEHYPAYNYLQNYWSPTGDELVVADISYCEHSIYNNGLFMTPEQYAIWFTDTGERVEQAGLGIKDGAFYTSTADYDFPCFFSLEEETYMLGGIHYFIFNSHDVYGAAVIACDESAKIEYPVSLENDIRPMLSISTPLERILLDEFATFTIPMCSESDCFTLGHEFIFYLNNGAGLLSDEFKPYLPCTTYTAKSIGRESEVYDTDIITQFSMVDDTYVDGNFCGLLIQKEEEQKTKAYYRDENSRYMCNGINYGTVLSGVPYQYNRLVGTVIYIFSPDFWWEDAIDPDTGDPIKENFWDIHAERVDENEINPNRCLDLEEHINGVLDDRNILCESISALPKIDSTGIWGLTTYGHEFFSGFTYLLG